MKKLSFVILVFLCLSSNAQSISEPNMKRLQQIEDSIKHFAADIVTADEWIDRFRADSFFTRGFVRALVINNSFWYNFDSLPISKLMAPDSSFKIFTWQVMKDFSYYHQRGAIQMRTVDGSLKLLPLFDISEFTSYPNDSVRDTHHWIGAIYYKIILKTFNNKKYYTLLGSDENDERSNKKWIEVLTFDAAGNPQFGGKFFSYPINDPTKPKQPVYRFCLEYKKDAGVRMNYDPRYDAIIFDHLTSEGDDANNKYSLIPYGDYEGFRWINGVWKFLSNPFANVIFDDKQSTFPAPLLDDKGKINEKKLLEQSKKNMEKVTKDNQ